MKIWPWSAIELYKRRLLEEEYLTKNAERVQANLIEDMKRLYAKLDFFEARIKRLELVLEAAKFCYPLLDASHPLSMETRRMREALAKFLE